MLRNKQTDKDKSILKLQRELSRLWQAKWNYPLIEVDVPYQNGWTKSFELRDDISRRTDAAVFKKILKRINSKVFCRTKNFLKRDGTAIPHDLDVIGVNEWEGLGWPEHYKKYFYFGYIIRHRRIIKCYSFINSYYFVDKIEPHIITHQRVVIPQVESRIAEIRAKMSRGLWNRLNNLKGCRRMSDDWRLSKQRAFEALNTKEIEDIRYESIRFNPYKDQTND